MTSKKKPETDVDALGAVLTRFLAKQDGAYYSAGGYFSGKTADLFFALCDDYPWFAISQRPHDSASLRSALRKSAKALHAEHRVIVTIVDGGRVTLHLAKEQQ